MTASFASSTAVAPVEAPRRLVVASADRLTLGIIGLAVVLGGALRAAMAQGDLWLDEVWSLDLVGRVSSAGAVFYGISHDNNHFLNSLWMFWMGPERPGWVYRAPAIGLGMVSVALAAWLGWRRSRAGAVAAALLAAVALPLVTYGSEARGYAGLIAATLLALAAFHVASDSGRSSRAARIARWVLGGAIGLGTLSHFTMLATLAVLGFSALLQRLKTQTLRQAVDAALDLFRPSLILLLPAMLAVAAGIAYRGGFELGNAAPSNAATFAHGYGDQLRFMLGLPGVVPQLLCFAGAGLIVGMGLRPGPRAPLQGVLVAAATIVLPAAMILVHLPNLEMARYYLVPGIVVLLAEADLVARLWTRGTPWGRIAAGVLLGLSLLGHAVADRSALAAGRGRYADALANVAGPTGHVTYGTHDRFWVEKVARAAASRRGLSAQFIAEADYCATPPDIFVAVPNESDTARPGTIVAGPRECQHRFVLRDAARRSNPLSGMAWLIYCRAD